MTGSLPAILHALWRAWKSDSMETMSRIAEGWAYGCRLPAPPGYPSRENQPLTFSSRSRKRLRSVSRSCRLGL